MILNFEEEQEQETRNNEHMKIPHRNQGDSFLMNNLKWEEIYN